MDAVNLLNSVGRDESAFFFSYLGIVVEKKDLFFTVNILFPPLGKDACKYLSLRRKMLTVVY